MSVRSKRLQSPTALLTFLGVCALGIPAFALAPVGEADAADDAETSAEAETTEARADGADAAVATATAATATAAKSKKKRLWRQGSGKPLAGTRGSLAPVVKAVRPAVVTVIAAGGERSRGLSAMFGRRGPAPQGMGSGFILRKDGLVVTNHHVVAQRPALKVRLADGRTFDADVLGTDPETDLALLRMSDAKSLPTVPLGSSARTEVGDWVIAIGSPMGLEQSATTGILSAKGRGSLDLYPGGSYVDFMQTDAAIAPGNSGGPLFNTAGEVIGINTAVGAFGRGPGFAIPVDQVKRVIAELHDHGRVRRGWLGISGRDIRPADNTLPPPGAVIGQVHPDTPAARAKLQAGDRIVQVDGKKVESFEDLRGRVADMGPDSSVALTVKRGDKTVKLQAKLEERPDQARLSRLGRAPAPAPKGSRSLFGAGPRRLGVEVKNTKAGLEIKNVSGGSVAANLGLRQGDVLRTVNGVPVASAKDVAAALGQDNHKVRVTVMRGGSQHTATLEQR